MLYASNVWSACSTGNLQRDFRLQKRSASIILDADTPANSDELLTSWFPLHLEGKVNICVQVHKSINGRSPGYMRDLLVLNSDILNERNNTNNSLNLVCPRFKRETGGGRRTLAVRATRLWNTVPNSLKKIECVHSFKKPLLPFMYRMCLLCMYFYCLITSYSQLLIVLFTVVLLIVIFRIILCIFLIVIVNFL